MGTVGKPHRAGEDCRVRVKTLMDVIKSLIVFEGKGY